MTENRIYVPQGLHGIAFWQGTKTLQKSLDLARTRLLVICSAFVLCFSIIIGRLVDVCLIKGQNESDYSSAVFSKADFRANITDRNGELLATSLRTSSMYANARVVIDAKEATIKLQKALPELSFDDTVQRLQSGKGFIWIARHLTPQKQAEILKLGIPGLYFQKDERRVYPHGELFAHVLGFTNIDSLGLAGVEREFDQRLVTDKNALELSLDMRVQHVLRDELLSGIDKFSAKGGAGLILNVKTGEILAMVSLPDFDPNQVGKIGSEKEILFNRITLGAYEMGSSFKIFNTALYLESGIASIYTKFDVSAPLRVGRFKITDYHQHPYPLTVAQIFTESSNIGAAKMALQVGSTRQQAFFNKLGFFKSPNLEISEIGSPLFPKNWSEATTITASYGYGISITPLQLATAIAGIVNKGVMVQPTLLRRNLQKSKGIRVVSEETSEIMRKLMYMVVAQGTGRKARVLGYEVGGKTGTANKIEGRSYKKGNNNTSFVGAFPMSRPQYVVMVMVDRPQGIKETYGFNAAGWNAAPIAGRVIERIAPLLQVIPSNERKMSGEENPLLIQVKEGH